MTHCSSRNWMDSTRNASNSLRRSPHPMSMASNRMIPLAPKRSPLHAGQQSLAPLSRVAGELTMNAATDLFEDTRDERGFDPEDSSEQKGKDSVNEKGGV